MASSNATKGCYAGIKAVGVCTNGVCNTTTGSCVCNPYYTGHGDFVTMVRKNARGETITLECGTNTIAIRVLWSIVLLVYLWTLFRMISTMHIQWGVYRRNKKLTNFLQHAPLRIYASGMIIMASSIALAMVKIVDPEQTIGTMPSCTILFMISRFLFFFPCAPMIQYEQMKSALMSQLFSSDRTKAEATLQRVRTKIGASMLPIAVVSLLLPVYLADDASTTEEVGLTEIVYVLFFGISACCNISQGYIGFSVARLFDDLFDELKNSANVRDLDRLETKRVQLVGLWRQVAKQALVFSLINVVFVAVPTLWTKMTYINPFSVLAWSLLCLKSLKAYRGGKIRPGEGIRAGTTATTGSSNTHGHRSEEMSVPTVVQATAGGTTVLSSVAGTVLSTVATSMSMSVVDTVDVRSVVD